MIRKLPSCDQAKILMRIGAGGIMILTWTANGPQYSLINGDHIPLSIAKSLISDEFVVPNQDALFNGAKSQTYRFNSEWRTELLDEVAV
jgi:hypothetical protein